MNVKIVVQVLVMIKEEQINALVLRIYVYISFRTNYCLLSLIFRLWIDILTLNGFILKNYSLWYIGLLSRRMLEAKPDVRSFSLIPWGTELWTLDKIMMIHKIEYGLKFEVNYIRLAFLYFICHIQKVPRRVNCINWCIVKKSNLLDIILKDTW